MNKLSIITNLAMVIFTGHYLVGFSWMDRWILFLITEHGFLFIVSLVDTIYPDDPPMVVMQQDRCGFFDILIFAHMLCYTFFFTTYCTMQSHIHI